MQLLFQNCQNSKESASDLAVLVELRHILIMKIFRINTICLLVSLLSGCVTDRPQVPKRDTTGQLQPKAEGGLQESVASVADSGESEKVQFIQSMAIANAREISPADHRLTTAITNQVDQSALDRAVLTLAGLRLSLQLQTNSQQYEEVDLFKGQDSDSDAEEKNENHTVEWQMKKYNIDLAKELQENPLIQSIQVYSLAVKALKKDSSAYRQSILAVCSHKLRNWTKFHQYVSSLPTENEKADIVEIEDPSSVADVRLADLTLVEAERLADRKDYQGAVKLAQDISENNPLSNSAKEKVRAFSNLAVQDLRRKAALAFQNALPVADLRIKQTYLKEAKDYLELALNDYPGAEQLGKIKENLAVISKDLDKITEQLGSGEEQDE